MSVCLSMGAALCCSVLYMHSHKFLLHLFTLPPGLHATLNVYGCIVGNIIRLTLHVMYTKSQAGDRLQVLRHSTGLEYFGIIRYTYMSIIT